MQATLREFEDWLEDSVPDAIMIAYEKALAKLEECLPFEDALVRHILMWWTGYQAMSTLSISHTICFQLCWTVTLVSHALFVFWLVWLLR